MRVIQLTSRFTFRLCTFVAVLIVGSGSSSADMLVSSRYTNEILRYDQNTGAFLGVFASGNGLAAPAGMTFGPNGNLYVANYGVEHMGLPGSVLQFDGQTGAFIGQFVDPQGPAYGVTFGPDGNLYASIFRDVARYDGSTGAPLNNFGMGVPGGIPGLNDLKFGADGNLYVAAQISSGAVLQLDGTTGTFLGEFEAGGDLDGATGLAFGPDGNLYVGSYYTSSVLLYNGMTGSFIDTFASGGGLLGANGLAFGPDSNLYVLSGDTDKILRYNGATGEFINEFASGGGLRGPNGIVFTPTQAVPEPTSMALLGLASLGGLGLRLRQRRRAKVAA